MSGGGEHEGEGAGGARRRRARLAALAVAGVVVVAGVVAAAALAGGGDGAGGDGEAADGGRVDIAVVGDSLIEQSRDQMAAHAAAAGLRFEAHAFGGSAPCDWRTELERLAEVEPRHLVLSFAGNDNTPCVNPEGGGPRDPQTIADAYAEMMPGLLDLFAGTDTEVYLVLPPPVGEPASEPAAAAIRATYRDLAADRPDLTLVDPAPLLGDADGRFAAALPCQPWERAGCGPDGTVTVRLPDGIHLTEAGGERYARAVLGAVGVPID
ncbi:MAG: GDSL-type esterase/lipase family protein [Thermoanaerobacterales bacterium]